MVDGVEWVVMAMVMGTRAKGGAVVIQQSWVVRTRPYYCSACPSFVWLGRVPGEVGAQGLSRRRGAMMQARRWVCEWSEEAGRGEEWTGAGGGGAGDDTWRVSMMGRLWERTASLRFSQSRRPGL